MIGDGYVDVPGGRVWYKIVGKGNGVPLLTLHGGPGTGHDYLEPLEALTGQRPVIFFDQLGCGKSEQPDDISLWRIERFVDEVAAVRTALGLDRIHLWGHSWGGWLAIEYMMSKPAGVESLTLASTSASLSQFAEETGRLKATLPPEILGVLERYEAVDDYENPEYEEAMMAFYGSFICRMDPWPEPLMRTVANAQANPVVYVNMQGPNEFTITGNLKDWDRSDRLAEITVPTLVTCGRYDEATPNCAARLNEGIPNSRLHIFEQSAHMAHLEETDSYLQIVGDFLNDVDER
ncbi:MAG: proline iminopeptidase-family hydrolase [Caldilineaceae bacterium]|nr:proline iminopeptidase-family hydrolase [Caldilineaceae bacterium]